MQMRELKVGGDRLGALIWLSLIFVAGVVIGRMGLPFIEPHVVDYVEVASDGAGRECTLAVSRETTVLGRTESEELTSVKCGEERHFGDTVFQCRCGP